MLKDLHGSNTGNQHPVSPHKLQKANKFNKYIDDDDQKDASPKFAMMNQNSNQKKQEGASPLSPTKGYNVRVNLNLQP